MSTGVDRFLESLVKMLATTTTDVGQGVVYISTSTRRPSRAARPV